MRNVTTTVPRMYTYEAQCLVVFSTLTLSMRPVGVGEE